MRKLLALALFSILLPSIAGADMHGAWTANAEPGKVQLFMTSGGWHQYSRTFLISELGLNAAVVEATSSTPVTMTVPRDAGTLVLEGTFKNGDGAGQFTFTPSLSYLDKLRSIGVAMDLSESQTEQEQLFRLAVNDVSIAYVRSMHATYPEASLRDIWKARAVGVSPEFLAELRGIDFTVSELHDATRLAAVGVTASYVRSMRAAGVEVANAREATRLRAVGVTPQFVAELAAAGYRNVRTRDLIRMKAVGVDSGYIRDMSRYKEKQ